jgi:hypothetical protein
MFSAPQSIAAANQPLRDDDARMKCNPVRVYAPVQVCWLNLNECERRRRDRSTLQRFNRSTIFLVDLRGRFLSVSDIMRFLAELVIIAALIFLGWNKPFKDQVAQASTTIESKLHGTGSKLQKNQDPSVRRY